MNKHHNSTSFLDRLAIAFMSGLLTLVTGVIVLMLLFLLFQEANSTFFSMGFKIVLIVALLMSIAGFLLMENLILKLLSSVWQLLYSIMRRFD